MGTHFYTLNRLIKYLLIKHSKLWQYQKPDETKLCDYFCINAKRYAEKGSSLIIVPFEHSSVYIEIYLFSCIANHLSQHLKDVCLYKPPISTCFCATSKHKLMDLFVKKIKQSLSDTDKCFFKKILDSFQYGSFQEVFS